MAYATQAIARREKSHLLTTGSRGERAPLVHSPAPVRLWRIGDAGGAGRSLALISIETTVRLIAGVASIAIHSCNQSGGVGQQHKPINCSPANRLETEQVKKGFALG